jgi:hypothetical protein
MLNGCFIYRPRDGISSPGLVVCTENNANKPFNESDIKDEGSA